MIGKVIFAPSPSLAVPLAAYWEIVRMKAGEIIYREKLSRFSNSKFANVFFSLNYRNIPLAKVLLEIFLFLSTERCKVS